MECSKCNNFGHTAEDCKLKISHDNDITKDICGLAFYAHNDKTKWYIDSGCTKHMRGNKDKFLTLKRNNGGEVSFGDNGTTKILGRGTIPLKGNSKA